MAEVRRRSPDESAADSRSVALAVRRETLERSLAGRFWLRFHASLMIAATFATGFLANAAMLQWPVHSVWLRWPVAVLAGYVMFFVLVRLWLAYVGIRPLLGRGEVVDDGGLSGGWPIDLPGGRGGGASFGGGGGGSGGAGASGAIDLPGSPSGTASFASSANPASGMSSGARSWTGGIGDVGDIGDGCLVVVLGLIVLALVAALVGGAIHLVWIAPEMLSDAAFAAMLSAGVVPGLRRANEPDWNGRVFRATLPVLAGTMAVVLAAAWAFTHWFPGLRTLGEAYRMLF